MRKLDRVKGSAILLLAILVHGCTIYAVLTVNTDNLTIAVFWLLLYSLNFLGIAVAIFHKPPEKNPIPKGRVIAIVPTFNEDMMAVVATIGSLLKQSVPIDEIHIVDDCSDKPMPKIPHKKVFYHWHKTNKGKREAQATALRSIGIGKNDFILTIDSDTILDSRATEYMLRALYDERVAAVSGTVLLKNRDKNLLTRAQEYQYGQAFLVGRSARRALGVLETTSGACSMYRGETLLFHLDDYLEHGRRYPFGDDRRLCIYALMEGKVLYVPESIVYTAAPENIRQLWKQNVRWGKSTWASFPYHMVNLGVKENFFVCHTYFSAILLPFVVAGLVLSLALGMHQIAISVILYHLVDAYTRTLLFASMREASFVERWLSWLFVTPLMVALVYAITLPTRYVALFSLKDASWGTRTKSAPSQNINEAI